MGRSRSTGGSKRRGLCASATPPTSLRCAPPNPAAPQSEFAKRNTKAMALSIDPIEDHRAWAPDISEITGTPLDFPIVADHDRKVAELFDSIHPSASDTSTVRAVFIVDPENKLRLILTYPKSVGRNFDETCESSTRPRPPIATPSPLPPTGAR
jgi:hypothetical protein